jgi:hypothetical protein
VNQGVRILIRQEPWVIKIIFLHLLLNYLSRGLMMEVDTRVVAAADELFAACDRARFPNVYDVRKRASVSMSVANRGMWDESVERSKRDELRVREAQKRENSALEASAHYRGQWESLKSQHADLVRTLRPAAKALRRGKATTLAMWPDA